MSKRKSHWHRIVVINKGFRFCCLEGDCDFIIGEFPINPVLGLTAEKKFLEEFKYCPKCGKHKDGMTHHLAFYEEVDGHMERLSQERENAYIGLGESIYE